MIILDFQPDEETLAKDLATSPESASSAVLEQTYWLMPTRFAIDGVDLLAFPGAYDTWRPQPVLGLATQLAAAVAEASSGTRSYCHMDEGGRLDFEPRGPSIQVSSTLLPGQALTAPAALLNDEVLAFRGRVRDFLLQRVPAMRLHSHWGTWFPE
jgi:hypothetical protein